MNTFLGLILIVLTLYLLKKMLSSISLQQLIHRQVVANQQSLISLILSSLQDAHPAADHLLQEASLISKSIDQDYAQVLRIIEPMRGHSAYAAERSIYVTYAQTYRQLQIACRRLFEFAMSPTEDNKGDLVEWLEHDYIPIEQRLADESD